MYTRNKRECAAHDFVEKSLYEERGLPLTYSAFINFIKPPTAADSLTRAVGNPKALSVCNYYSAHRETGHRK